MRFYYHPATFNKNQSVCDVNVFGNLAVITELRENPGISVTNASAKIANTICKLYEINPKELIVIETHEEYPYLDLVEYKIINSFFCNPKWKRLTSEEVQELVNNRVKFQDKQKVIKELMFLQQRQLFATSSV